MVTKRSIECSVFVVGIIVLLAAPLVMETASVAQSSSSQGSQGEEIQGECEFYLREEIISNDADDVRYLPACRLLYVAFPEDNEGSSSSSESSSSSSESSSSSSEGSSSSSESSSSSSESSSSSSESSSSSSDGSSSSSVSSSSSSEGSSSSAAGGRPECFLVLKSGATAPYTGDDYECKAFETDENGNIATDDDGNNITSQTCTETIQVGTSRTILYGDICVKFDGGNPGTYYCSCLWSNYNDSSQ